MRNGINFSPHVGRMGVKKSIDDAGAADNGQGKVIFSNDMTIGADGADDSGHIAR